METIHIRKRIDSDTLKLPELAKLMGKLVEIIVLEIDPAKANGSSNPLAGTILKYDDPFSPAVPPEDWEANQ